MLGVLTTAMKKKSQPPKPKRTEDAGALAPGLEALADGNYPEARALLREIAEDPSLSTSEREMAEEYRSATGLERGAVLTGLGCLLFFGLVILFAYLKQP